MVESVAPDMVGCGWSSMLPSSDKAVVYLTEFVGTGVLTFIIGIAAGQGQQLTPFAIGMILTALIYFGGHISGAQYNPAVTLAVLTRGKLDLQEAICYVMAQLTGAFAFGGIAYIFDGDLGAVNYSLWRCFSDWP